MSIKPNQSTVVDTSTCSSDQETGVGSMSGPLQFISKVGKASGDFLKKKSESFGLTKSGNSSSEGHRFNSLYYTGKD